MNPQIVTVNLIPGLSTPAVVRISQYDVERPITFRVLDGNKAAVFPDACTATIEGTKPSGLGFSLLGTIAPGGIVNFTTAMSVTQECGMIPTEIRFSTNAYGSFPATDIGTANFILAVEPSPHPEGTTDGTQETMQNLETRLQGQIDALDTRVDALEAGQGGGSGLTDDVKNALLQIAQKVAYIDAHGQDYYDDLYDALYNDTTRSVLLVLSHVSSSNTQSTVEVGDSYTTTLTASTNYTINSVTVTMGGVDVTSTTYSSGTVSIPSVTGNIVITATAVLAAQSITATYTQSGTVYDTDSLDSLKTDLVVTANYSGGTSETVPASDYTLSGTLTAGTSTITVSYAGLTDTFDVTVTHKAIIDYTLDALENATWTDGYTYDKTTGELKTTSGEHSTDKFEVQDCIYQFSDTTNTATYYGLFMWDSDDNYLGYAESNNTFGNLKYLPNMQLKPDYKYALKVYNTGSFDSSTIKMMPVDNRLNAVNEFSINLSDYVDSISQVGSFNGAMVCELIISDILTAKGISLTAYNSYINRISTLGAISVTNNTGLNGNQKGSYTNMFKTGFLLYQGNVYMQMAVYGVTTLEDLKSYITTNNVVITFNY